MGVDLFVLRQVPDFHVCVCESHRNIVEVVAVWICFDQIVCRQSVNRTPFGYRVFPPPSFHAIHLPYFQASRGLGVEFSV